MHEIYDSDDRESVGIALGCNVSNWSDSKISEELSIFNNEIANKSSIGTCNKCNRTDMDLWDSLCYHCSPKL